MATRKDQSSDLVSGGIELQERAATDNDTNTITPVAKEKSDHRYTRNADDDDLLTTIESAEEISNFFSFLDRVISNNESLPSTYNEDRELQLQLEKQQDQKQRSFLLKDIVKDWIATTIIGFLVVSYWRGTWVLLDIWLCNQPKDASMINGNSFCLVDDEIFLGKTRHDSAIIAYAMGITFTLIGIAMMWCGLWTPPDKETQSTRAKSKRSTTIPACAATTIPITKTRITFWRSMLRISIIYILGFGTVCTWRGIWYLTDYWIYPHDPLTSYWTTTLVGTIGSFSLYAGASLLAPPAIFIMDGPSIVPPPLAVTIVSSYYSLTLPAGEKAPKHPKVIYFADIIVSFVWLPIFIVWFWRGIWYLMDEYLYGFTPHEHDLHVSLGYSAIIACVCLILASDDVLYWVTLSTKAWIQILDRLRTIILALGAVNFWRVVWLIWDEFCFNGEISHTSAWVSHIVGIIGLILMGCLSCILAPSATLGVDAEPHEDCAEEPLFSNIPVPAETLFLFGISRNVKQKKTELSSPSSQQLPAEDESAQLSSYEERRFSYEDWFYDMQRPRLSMRSNVSSTATYFSLRTQTKRRQSSFAFRNR